MTMLYMFHCLAELWVSGIRSLPVASLEHHASIESYHLMMKSKLFDDRHSSFWPRVDWLIHTLTTEFHSLFWLDQYIEETGYFLNMRSDTFSRNAWYQSLNIPDVDVILDEQNPQLAKVVSQADRTRTYIIWNPGSEFTLCNCAWSSLGNVCKHVLKVSMLCKNRQVSRPLLAAQTYKQILLTLLQNPPDDPLVLDHTILHAARFQQDIKSLEDLSDSGLLQPVQPDMNCQVTENTHFFPRLHWLGHWKSGQAELLEYTCLSARIWSGILMELQTYFFDLP